MLERNKQKLSWTKRCVSLLLVMLLTGGCGNAEKAQSPEGSIKAYTVEQNELQSNRHTMPEGEKAALMTLSTDGYEAMAENEHFVLYYKEEAATIRLLNKKNGYVWGCLSTEQPEDLNKKWTAYGNSIVAVEYSDEENKVSVLGAAKQHLSVKKNENGMEFSVDLGSVGIFFDFKLVLSEDGFAFEMDDASIQENDENRLVSVTFLPYWGSVRGNEISGYMFVPDGCGALIRFREPRSYLNGFSKRIYGSDYGVDSMSVINDLGSERINVFAADEKTVSVPVFGMAHGNEQNAYLSIVEQGAEYAQINADPAGIVTNYNRIHATFIYRSVYEQPINKKGSGVQSVQKSRNQVQPRISYHFLSEEEADYVGMAKGYRTYLEKQGLLPSLTEKRENIPMSIDFLVADVQKEFLGSSVNQITEAADIVNFLSKLKESEIEGYQISLLGWQKKGLHGYSVLSDSKKSIFTEEELEKLEEEIQNATGKLNFSAAYFSGSELQLNTKKEASITMSQEVAVIPAQDESLYLQDQYLLKPKMALNGFETGAKDGAESLLIEDMGYMLYGEYLENKVTTRSEVLLGITEAFQNVFTDKGAAVVRPNAYLYPYVSAYRDIALVNSQYVFETDTVPFLQILLSGHETLYSPYLNCGLYSKMDLLKLIDYGVYPSFILTGKNNYELRESASSTLLSSAISDWQDYVTEAYQFVNGVLRYTYGEEILDREVLSTGLVRIDYPSGSIYVNYTESDRQVDGVNVPKQSAIYAAQEGGMAE